MVQSTPRAVECDQCGMSFETRHPRQKRCSPVCTKAYQKAFNAANKDRYRERKNAHMRVYSASRKSEKAAYDREHYAKNKEKRAKQKRAHYLANLETYREYSASHRDAQLTRNAERRARYPDEAREQRHRRRAIIYNAGKSRVTKEDLGRMRRRACGLCEYCLAALGEHWDHRVPLVRGGDHSVGNLTLACAQCNFQKHAKTVTEWRLWRRRAGLVELAAFRFTVL